MPIINRRCTRLSTLTKKKKKTKKAYALQASVTVLFHCANSHTQLLILSLREAPQLQKKKVAMARVCPNFWVPMDSIWRRPIESLSDKFYQWSMLVKYMHEMCARYEKERCPDNGTPNSPQWTESLHPLWKCGLCQCDCCGYNTQYRVWGFRHVVLEFSTEVSVKPKIHDGLCPIPQALGEPTYWAKYASPIIWR